jgi:hypothetical protein
MTLEEVRVHTDRFFPDQGDPATEPKQMCAGCPVWEPCLLSALTSTIAPVGVWAGTGQRQRAWLRDGLVVEIRPLEMLVQFDAVAGTLDVVGVADLIDAEVAAGTRSRQGRRLTRRSNSSVQVAHGEVAALAPVASITDRRLPQSSGTNRGQQTAIQQPPAAIAASAAAGQ